MYWFSQVVKSLVVYKASKVHACLCIEYMQVYINVHAIPLTINVLCNGVQYNISSQLKWTLKGTSVKSYSMILAVLWMA